MVIVLTILIIPFSSQVFGENDLDVILEQENGVQIEQQKIIFEIGKRGDVHVKHLIETGKWDSDRPRILEILPGSHSNLNVVDEDGDLLTHSFDGETFEESRYIILEQKLGNYDLIAEYDLDNFMELKDGLWMKEILFSSDVMIMVDEDIELIFVNSRPIDVSDAKGINCIGCGITLEYFDEDKFSSGPRKDWPDTRP